jgi:hypothetical protein
MMNVFKPAGLEMAELMPCSDLGVKIVNNVLHDYQFGLHKKHSKSLALLEVVDST